jgi:hypothetical protein
MEKRHQKQSQGNKADPEENPSLGCPDNVKNEADPSPHRPTRIKAFDPTQPKKKDGQNDPGGK